MPTDDGLGLDDDEHAAPARPEMPERHPEQSVQGVQNRARPLAFKHGNLLSKGKDFKGCVASALPEVRIPGQAEQHSGLKPNSIPG